MMILIEHHHSSGFCLAAVMICLGVQRSYEGFATGGASVLKWACKVNRCSVGVLLGMVATEEETRAYSV